jgi:glucan phosphoethanolaminetransferase (alkaline phosphatase superfamily)
VVWIIGESLNRANMSLYGYERPTSPTLESMRKELIVFRDVVSSAPATMDSLMKMLTPADLNDPAGLEPQARCADAGARSRVPDSLALQPAAQ